MTEQVHVKPRIMVDPRIDTREVEGVYTCSIREGAASSTYWSQQSDQGAGNTASANWTIQVPSRNIGLSRALRIRICGVFVLGVTGTANNASVADLLNSTFYAALRAFPIQQAVNTVSVNINGTNISTGNLQRMLPALATINTGAATASGFASTGNYVTDFTADYGATAGANPVPIGALVSAFRTADQNPQGSGVFPNRTRGLGAVQYFLTTAGATNGAAAAGFISIPVDITENLILPPLAYGSDDADACLFGVNQVRIQMLFSNWSRSLAWFVNNVTNGIQTVASCNFYTANLPSTGAANPPISNLPANPGIYLEYSFHTPSGTAEIQRAIQAHYPAAQYDFYETAYAGTISTGQAVSNWASQTQTLASVPRKIIVFAQRSQAETTNRVNKVVYPDMMLAITKANITLGNTSGILADASQRQLWQMSLANGCMMDWPRWSGQTEYGLGSTAATQPALFTYAGGPLVLDVASLGLPDGVFSGVGRSITFGIKVDVRNQSGTDAVAPSLCVLFLYDGYLVLKDGASNYQRVNLTPQEAAGAERMNAGAAASMDAAFTASGPLAGGSFLGFLGNIARGATHAFQKVMDEAPKFAGVLGPAGVGLANTARLLKGGAYESPTMLNARLRALRD